MSIRQINVKNNASRMSLYNVEATITPVDAFKRVGFEYDGTTAIIVAGSPIKASQAYSPISEIIGTEDYDGVVTISAIAKHDNAFTVQTIGNSVYVVSDYTPDEIKEIIKWKPSATWCAEDGKPFSVYVAEEGEGNIDSNEAVFAKGDVNGKAFIHVCLPDDMTMEEFKKEFTTLEISHQLWMLKNIEDGFKLALEEIEQRKQLVVDCFAE